MAARLFLDEIGDMPLNLQARLLRVLQERSVTPLGQHAGHPGRHLAGLRHAPPSARGSRPWQFPRGSVLPAEWHERHPPALRERSDIRQLVAKLAAEEVRQSTPIRFSESAMQAIEGYNWPGNIRQLFNVVRVAIALLDEGETLITESHLPEELFEAPLSPGNAIPLMSGRDPWAPAPLDNEPGSLEEIGRLAALRTLESVGGNISAAARQLGISRNTLYRKLGKL
jgi:sigma-54 dependent transcriptional regulator, acetoin dehydrogenase operon transcriptional activator AcoR